MTDSKQTVEAARRALRAKLKRNNIETAELDARILVGAVLGLDLTGVIAQAARILTPDEITRLDDFTRRRLAGEPVARITGLREFWGLPLKLSTETLVPRPDSETVVELALEMLRAGRPANQALRIADIGTGSGAILLALLSELPDAHGTGSDISEAALQTAHSNAVRLGLVGRARFIACDYAAALAGDFDLIVSNPPYIRSAEIDSLEPEVRDHDPRRALDGGSDGLDAYRVLVPQAAKRLVPGGILVVEVGAGQSTEVSQLMTVAGLTVGSAPKADLAGVPRAVAGHKRP